MDVFHFLTGCEIHSKNYMVGKHKAPKLNSLKLAKHLKIVFLGSSVRYEHDYEFFQFLLMRD